MFLSTLRCFLLYLDRGQEHETFISLLSNGRYLIYRTYLNTTRHDQSRLSCWCRTSLPRGGQVVRDMQKILETLREHEKKQQTNKVELVQGCLELTKIVQELGEKTGITCNALDEKTNIIKDFIVKQAEKITMLELRIANLEDKLNAKN